MIFFQIKIVINQELSYWFDPFFIETIEKLLKMLKKNVEEIVEKS